MKSARHKKVSFMHKYWKQLVLILVLFGSVLLTAFLSKDIVHLLSQAAPIPANIVVDVASSKGKLEHPWAALSQGGESESNGSLVSLSPVTSQIKALSPKYIRLDHVFDRPYENRVREILAAGAVPFISLSYFPADVANRDVGTVNNWSAWERHVRDLVENVSGRDHLNVSGVYYEVWNEPDGPGFGAFDIGRGKDYFELYEHTLAGVNQAINVNDFKVGGPALADLRRCNNGLLFVCQTFWLDDFFRLVASRHARLDFISWHRYSPRLSDYNEDVNFITALYTKHATLPPAEKIITEWGSTPERNPVHNSVLDAAHLVAAARTFVGFVDLATKFEVRDGPESGRGGWGILYYNGQPKPSYHALRLLNMLRSERVLLSGEGTNVTGIASRDSSGATVILINYDQRNSHIETVPVSIINLPPGRYRLTKHVLNSSSPQGKEKIDTFASFKGTYTTSEIMLPNSVVVYDLQLVGLFEG
ncbi:hypothetical protein A2721_01345 [Candidatus Gottesmanbacteria bacterium RIFCSPHIGHO2_01_FULL_47_48]|uniref:Glycosyl hydrolases family 39 N-terminal catalytic domain-containing protein n=1 Tax=Candidatus Gottesmanbacteria bacterium RIFCSPHIGHO2_01_FULL_47_48 TaxID=1798381 RepID=A0A1F6A523_9BACT|nr:MAG: hypothetical protein A2721_01345 [Candidatus Gottesmanbacteria bacterium RIFCSPHIGHO2_01_FULL_47_48]